MHRLLPTPIRRFGARQRRALHDWWHGRHGTWVAPPRATGARPREPGPALTPIGAYACPILNPAFQQHVYENKMHNLALVQSRLDGVTLRPGEMFSFWRLVGQPDEAHGFKVASNFIAGRVTFAEGGGICQLTSALYNAALLAGLDVLERHAHTIDAYGANRYVPLGRDATVVYGYKDLVFKNATAVPMTLRVVITSDSVATAFDAPAPAVDDVRLEVEALSPDSLHTRTRRWRDGRCEIVSEDRYALPAT